MQHYCYRLIPNQSLKLPFHTRCRHTFTQMQHSHSNSYVWGGRKEKKEAFAQFMSKLYIQLCCISRMDSRKNVLWNMCSALVIYVLHRQWIWKHYSNEVCIGYLQGTATAHIKQTNKTCFLDWSYLCISQHRLIETCYVIYRCGGVRLWKMLRFKTIEDNAMRREGRIKVSSYPRLTLHTLLSSGGRILMILPDTTHMFWLGGYTFPD